MDSIKAPSSIRLTTFNIRYGSCDDGPNFWEFRRTAVARFLNDLDSDVVCLQEMLHWQYSELLELIGSDRWAGEFVGRDDGRTKGESCAVIYQHGRVRSTSAPTPFWLSDTPDVPGTISASWGNRLPRMCLVLHFIRAASGSSFYVFNTHLDHESATARRRGAELITRRLQDVLAPGGPPVFVTGDMNEGPDGTAVRAFRADLVDVLHAHCPSSDDRGTIHEWSGRDLGRERHIDYIFFAAPRPAMKRDASVDGPPLSVLEASIITHRVLDRLISDHFPVTAVVEFDGM
jgi:endonuclease/exonuclease/phosphatase family metal-dependent hydrolase